MKKYNTINKQPDIDVFKIKKMNFSIQGEILYMTSSENNNIFIITESKYFYVIEKGMEKYTKKYKIPTTWLKNRKYQTEDLDSHIWCNKLGNHAIIKFKNNIYYYNPNIPKEKIQELYLYYNNIYLQPYAIAFNNDYYEITDTGEILFSDYNSDIYKLRIKIDKNKLTSFFSPIFSFNTTKERINDKEEEDEEEDEDYFEDLNFFKMNKNEKILDMKIIISCESMDTYDSNLNSKGKNILIIAITNNKLFQFYGKDSYEDVFKNYSIENGDILKSYKLFPSKKNFQLNKSRIQLFNQYLPFYKFETFEKPEIVFSCMFPSGYCIGRFEDLCNITPQKEFILFDYPKMKNKNEFPIMVCQSMIHIFYLFKARLFIKNKLTNRIANITYIKEKFLDIYYNLVMNEVILYNSTNIYSIPLDLEHKYLWEYYLEIGQYKFALKTLTNEDKHMKPILHKLYGNLLFEQKKYSEAVEHFALSDEKFEHVCLKFLSINNIESLLKYLALIFHYKLEKKNTCDLKKEKNPINSEKYFIEKYLLNTWIFELLITKKENHKNTEMIPFIRDYTRNNIHGLDYINKNLIYYIFNCYSKYDELIEYAKINQDYEFVIYTLINNGNDGEALGYFQILFCFGNENLKNIKRIFFKYSSLLMKKYPKETLMLLENNLNISNNPKDITRILLNYNFQTKNNISNEGKIIIIINYIKKIIQNNPKKNILNNDFNENTNIYNLLILFLSLINNKDDNKSNLINYLKDLINKKTEKIYFDLNFSKIILKDNPTALAIIYYLHNKYDKCVEISMDNNISHILKFLIEKTDNKNILNRLLHNILDYKKKNNIFKSIINKNSVNRFKIVDDFYLKITDNLNINIFHDDKFYVFIINFLFK